MIALFLCACACFCAFVRHFLCLCLSLCSLNASELDQMSDIEQVYGKKYPMGENDFFRIVHCPNYRSFFDQFAGWDYLVKKNTTGQITSTCCFVSFQNPHIRYLCDLKKISGSNATLLFIVYFWLFLSASVTTKMFGIVMEPNETVHRLATQYGFQTLKTLHLYKIPFALVKAHFPLFCRLFSPNFFIVPGYKQFILNSTGQPLRCYHIAQPGDLAIVRTIQDPISFDAIEDTDDIMFCFGEECSVLLLKDAVGITPINKMSVIANQWIDKAEFDLDAIKTYMI